MNYQETLDYLFSLLPMFQRVGHTAFKKDLTNTLKLCKHLDNPEKKFKSIHIAGTNGKGSTAHALAAVFQVAGYKTGLYTSPHLKSFTERIRINGTPIDEQSVVDFVEKNKPIIEEVKPSFFEMTVAMAFDHFAEQKVDLAIIEVGMGGNFDSTNVIIPELSVITNISLDHQAFLGNTLAEIAFEKAGIIKPQIPVVVSEKQKEVEQVFVKKAKDQKAPLTFATDTYQVKEKKLGSSLLNFDVYKDGDLFYSDLEYELTGHYQLKNLPGILKAIEIMQGKDYKIEKDHLYTAFRSFKTLTGLRGRWEKLQDQPLIICDTGHNEEGISQVVSQIKKIPYRKLFFILGLVKDKSQDNVLKLLPKEANYIFAQANIPRAMEAEELKEQAFKHGLEGIVIKNVNEAINFAKSKVSDKDFIFIGGSTFLVAEIDSL